MRERALLVLERWGLGLGSYPNFKHIGYLQLVQKFEWYGCVCVVIFETWQKQSLKTEVSGDGLKMVRLKPMTKMCGSCFQSFTLA